MCLKLLDFFDDDFQENKINKFLGSIPLWLLSLKIWLLGK